MTSTEDIIQQEAAERSVLLYPDSTALPDRPTPRAGLNSAKLYLVIADIAVVFVSLVAATWTNRWINPTDPVTVSSYLGLVMLSLPVWPLAFTQQLLYRARYLGRVADELPRVVRGVAIAVLLVLASAFAVKVDIGRWWLTLVIIFTTASVVTERLVARTLFKRARYNGTLLRQVVIVGRNAEGQLVRDMLESDPSLGYRFEGFVEDLIDLEPGESPLHMLGDPSRVTDKIKDMGITSAIVATTAIDVGTSNRLIRALTEHGIHVELSSSLCDIAAHRLTIRPVGRIPMMYVEPVPRGGWHQRAKRAFDVVTAAMLLVLSSPIWLASAIAIKLTSPGPVLFHQERVGRDGELFSMKKLRTMVVDAEAQFDELAELSETTGPLFKIRNDPRITPVGKWLRKLSIDELPQLFNVIRGDMSLVGPRPALAREVENWDAELHNRLRVAPGITGMWQVMGRSEGDHDSRYAQLDLYYVDNWNLVTDLVVLARTVPVVLGRKGQY